MSDIPGTSQIISLRCQIDRTDYVITEEELSQLSNGPRDKYKEFFLSTIGLSIPCILNMFGYFKDPFEWSYGLFFNTMIGGICFLASLVLGKLWLDNRNNMNKLIESIMNKPKINVKVISTGASANTAITNTTSPTSA